MILPIYAYGQPVLKKVAEEIDKDYPGLQQLIEDMYETMYHAEGVGLAAPQVGLSIRLFVIDTTKKETERKPQDRPQDLVKKIFINPQLLDESGKPWTFEEGCLSIPDITGDVVRPSSIRLRYSDESFTEFDEVFDGLLARVIQHEYDHLEGVLFTELLKPLKRQMVKRKLDAIKRGEVKVDYKMKFAKK